MSLEKPDYEKFTTVDQLDREIEKHKDTVCHKVKVQGQTKQQKKDSNAGFNEAINYLQEEIDHEVEVIDELKRRKQEVDGTAILRVQPLRA